MLSGRAGDHASCARQCIVPFFSGGLSVGAVDRGELINLAPCSSGSTAPYGDDDGVFMRQRADAGRAIGDGDDTPIILVVLLLSRNSGADGSLVGALLHALERNDIECTPSHLPSHGELVMW